MIPRCARVSDLALPPDRQVPPIRQYVPQRVYSDCLERFLRQETFAERALGLFGCSCDLNSLTKSCRAFKKRGPHNGGPLQTNRLSFGFG